MVNKINTLSDLRKDSDDGEGLDFKGGEFSIIDRLNALKNSVNRKDEFNSKVIYWEAQGKDRMCALHCLNSLVQGPEFTESDLSTVALSLDNKERSLIQSTLGASEDLKDLLAGGSMNASEDGFFSISVLLECLRQRDMICLASTSRELKHVINDPTVEEAFLCNHAEHWFSVRKIYGKWYNLDSLKPAPAKVSEFYVSAFLRDLIDKGYAVYVVRYVPGSYNDDMASSSDVLSASFPLPLANSSRRESRLNNNQVYLTEGQIDELNNLDAEYHLRTIAEESKRLSGGRDAEHKGNSSKDNQNHIFPVEGGRRLREGEGETFDTAISQAVDSQEDPELAAALKLSMDSYYETLRGPPPEPAECSTDVITIQVRLSDGRRMCRKFNKTDAIGDIFLWLEFDRSLCLNIKSQYNLISQFPRREFSRVNNSNVFVSEKSESSKDDLGVILTDVTQTEIFKMFKASLETLILGS